jgi:hypothetical protein
MTARTAAAAVALAAAAIAVAGCASAPSRALALPSAIPAPGTVTDSLGASCPAAALTAAGLCPADANPVVTDARGVSCRAGELAQDWCPGDAPSWPPPAPVPVPETVTFIVRGGPAAVSYGAYGDALAAGSSPMTLTEPLRPGADGYVLSALTQGAGPVTVTIAVDGAIVASSGSGDGGAALAEAVRNGNNWESGLGG